MARAFALWDYSAVNFVWGLYYFVLKLMSLLRKPCHCKWRLPGVGARNIIICNFHPNYSLLTQKHLQILLAIVLDVLFYHSPY